VFFQQFIAGVAGSEIERIPVAHVAGNAKLPHQRFQVGDRLKAGAVRARGPLEAVGIGTAAPQVGLFGIV
jgi:hypothetical protein